MALQQGVEVEQREVQKGYRRGLEARANVPLMLELELMFGALWTWPDVLDMLLRQIPRHEDWLRGLNVPVEETPVPLNERDTRVVSGGAAVILPSDVERPHHP